MTDEQRQRANDVRAFLRGFIGTSKMTRRVDPLGHTITEAILQPMSRLPDDAIDLAIERGYATERRQPGGGMID